MFNFLDKTKIIKLKTGLKYVPFFFVWRECQTKKKGTYFKPVFNSSQNLISLFLTVLKIL